MVFVFTRLFQGRNPTLHSVAFCFGKRPPKRIILLESYHSIVTKAQFAFSVFVTEGFYLAHQRMNEMCYVLQNTKKN